MLALLVSVSQVARPAAKSVKASQSAKLEQEEKAALIVGSKSRQTEFVCGRFPFY